MKRSYPARILVEFSPEKFGADELVKKLEELGISVFPGTDGVIDLVLPK